MYFGSSNWNNLKWINQLICWVKHFSGGSLLQHAPPGGETLYDSLSVFANKAPERRIIPAIRFFWTVRFNEPVQIVDSQFLLHDVFTSLLELVFQMLLLNRYCTYSVILRRKVQTFTNKNIQDLFRFTAKSTFT